MTTNIYVCPGRLVCPLCWFYNKLLHRLPFSKSFVQCIYLLPNTCKIIDNVKLNLVFFNGEVPHFIELFPLLQYYKTINILQRDNVC